MRVRHCVILACLALPLPASAGYSGGIAAYRLGDYSTALAELRPLAEQGNADAQFTVGLMYAQGSGVLQDYVQAHKWLNLAAARGNRDAASTRESIARRMTTTQIAEAQRLARAYRPTASAASAARDGSAGTGLPALPSASTAAPASASTVKRLQAVLGERGYDAGPADGLMGRRTRDAIRAYQGDHGLRADGVPSASLLAHVEANPRNVKPGSWADAGSRAASRAPVSSGSPTPAASASDDDDRVQALVAELRALVRDAEQRRTADRAFLRALGNLASRYDDPWQTLLLEERFPSAADAKRRGWQVATGEFEVVGDGLRSRVEAVSAAQAQQPRSAEEQALALLGAIVSQAGGDSVRYSSTKEAGEAEAFVPLAIAEAFHVEVVFRSGRAPAHLEVALYQGTARTQGYALAYRAATGTTPRVELSRRSVTGSNVVSQRSFSGALEDGREHTLVWSRGRDGDIEVSLDGQLLVAVTERGVNGAFDGLRLRNLGGEFTVREVVVHADG